MNPKNLIPDTYSCRENEIQSNLRSQLSQSLFLPLSPNHQLLSLSSDFVRRIVKVHGPEGKTWIKNLPALRAQCFERWSLTNAEPLSGLSYYYLEKAKTEDGSAVILKLGLPNPELSTEILALRYYGGKGAVRLMQADPQLGALLLEQVQSGYGTPLEENP